MLFFGISVSVLNAQNPIQVACGGHLESTFNSDAEVHTYQIHIEAGTALVIDAESAAGNYEHLRIDLELTTPRGNVVTEWRYGTQYTYDNYEIQHVLSFTKDAFKNKVAEWR